MRGRWPATWKGDEPPPLDQDQRPRQLLRTASLYRLGWAAGKIRWAKLAGPAGLEKKKKAPVHLKKKENEQQAGKRKRRGKKGI